MGRGGGLYIVVGLMEKGIENQGLVSNFPVGCLRVETGLFLPIVFSLFSLCLFLYPLFSVFYF